MTCNVSMWDMAVINRVKVEWSVVLNTAKVREAGFQHASKVAGGLYADDEWLDVDTVYPRRLYAAVTDGSKCQAPRFPFKANTRCKHSCIHATKLLPDNVCELWWWSWWWSWWLVVNWLLSLLQQQLVQTHQLQTVCHLDATCFTGRS